MSRRESPGADKFREFHRKEPRKIGEFHSDLEIPSHMRLLGVAKHVLYRSDKVDPETGEQPKEPLDYIHEHDAGVSVYVPCDRDLNRGFDSFIEIPREPSFWSLFKGNILQDPSLASGRADELDIELVRLGTCLGFAFEDEDGEHEATAVRPMPELYCSTSGRTLLVIQGKRELLALMHGGALGVESRGIVG